MQDKNVLLRWEIELPHFVTDSTFLKLHVVLQDCAQHFNDSMLLVIADTVDSF